MKSLIWWVLIAMMLTPAGQAAKPRQWIAGTVTNIETVTARVMDHSAGHEYTIRTESADYVLEHAAFSYYTAAPEKIVAIGDSVQISKDGSKHFILKTKAGEKKLRLIRTKAR